MEADTCIVATIAPEATLKSFHVRKFIEKKLKDNIKILMKNNLIELITIDNIGARYAIETSDNKKAFELLKKCFGIYSLSFTQKVAYKKLSDIVSVAPKYFNHQTGTFAIKGKSYSKEFSSKQLEEECGGAILDSFPNLKVNLSSPQNILYCINSKKYAYFFTEKVVGAKGMPVGSQGAVVLICSGKKDEKLALLLMQNGCVVKTIDGKIENVSEWNSYMSLNEIDFDNAKKLFSERRINAFFTSLTDTEKIQKMSELAGTKVFAPLIIDSYIVPEFEKFN
jgi:adenylyl- and sulfurtransferase ThiI